MPNTLVHLGVQGFVHRGVDRGVDLRLVYLGCIIPDVPWIGQRAIRALWPTVDRIELALYCGVQSSLAFCLLLGAALAAVTRRPRETFTVLAIGSAFHLVLDITQIKWGNGAMFLAPFSWEITSLGWAWPEHSLFTWLTFLSAGFVLATWRRIDHRPLLAGGIGRWLTAASLLAVYAATPPLFADELLAADTYDSATLSDRASRDGRPVAFDRAAVVSSREDHTVARIFTGESIRLEGVSASPPALISVRGTFTDADTVRVAQYHLHPRSFRDYASIAGLALLAAVWLQSMFRWLRRRPR